MGGALGLVDRSPYKEVTTPNRQLSPGNVLFPIHLRYVACYFGSISLEAHLANLRLAFYWLSRAVSHPNTNDAPSHVISPVSLNTLTRIRADSELTRNSLTEDRQDETTGESMAGLVTVACS